MNKDIIDFLKKYIDGKRNTERVEISVIQLNRVIKALEQQSEDAISRQAAIDALDKRFDEIPMKQTTEILSLRKDLRTLPPVQPKYNQGYKQGASDVINKIKIEIEFKIDHRTNMLCVEDVFAILDKYGSESRD